MSNADITTKSLKSSANRIVALARKRFSCSNDAATRRDTLLGAMTSLSRLEDKVRFSIDPCDDGFAVIRAARATVNELEDMSHHMAQTRRDAEIARLNAEIMAAKRRPF